MRSSTPVGGFGADSPGAHSPGADALRPGDPALLVEVEVDAVVGSGLAGTAGAVGLA